MSSEVKVYKLPDEELEHYRSMERKKYAHEDKGPMIRGVSNWEWPLSKRGKALRRRMRDAE